MGHVTDDLPFVEIKAQDHFRVLQVVVLATGVGFVRAT